MTQEEKDLLLKDLCARLPYDVKVNCNDKVYNFTGIHSFNICVLSDDNEDNAFTTAGIKYVKPYLFPLSSMTEEQKRELLELTGYEPRCEESCGFDSWGFYVNIVGEYKYEENKESIILYPDDIGIDWLNANHFDFRGLIEKGLANDATGLNIY